jgi:membrane-associated phospholipid phosphatase
MLDSRAPAWIKALAAVLAASVCASTILVGQHYYGDLAGGAVTALAGYVLARWIVREKRA